MEPLTKNHNFYYFPPKKIEYKLYLLEESVFMEDNLQ